MNANQDQMIAFVSADCQGEARRRKIMHGYRDMWSLDNCSPHPGPVDSVDPALSAAALVLVTVHMMSELEGGCRV